MRSSSQLSISCLSLLFPSLILLSGCREIEEVASITEEETLVTFAVMGDVPYGITSEEQELEKATLRQQITDLNHNEAIAFVVHLGDIKKGDPPCAPNVYEEVAEILQTSTHPLFIIPGDNEWNDCANPTEAWNLWKTHFMKFDNRWDHHLEVSRQSEREENFAFLKAGVLFIGINLVNGKVHDWEEWETRIEDDRRWIESQFKQYHEEAFAAVIFAHANPGTRTNQEFVYNKQAFRPLIEYLDKETAADFPRPILFFHGDGHKWIADLPFPTAGERIGRIQVTQGGLEAPLIVEIRDDPENPFSWTRKLSPQLR